MIKSFSSDKLKCWEYVHSRLSRKILNEHMLKLLTCGQMKLTIRRHDWENFFGEAFSFSEGNCLLILKEYRVFERHTMFVFKTEYQTRYNFTFQTSVIK